MDRDLVQALRKNLFPFTVRSVFSLLPRRFWYRAALGLCKPLAFIYDVGSTARQFHYGDRALKQAWLLTSLLEILATARRAFPVPYRVNGHQLVLDSSTTPGLFIVMAHLPLSVVIGRVFYDANRPLRVITQMPRDFFLLYGTADGATPTVVADEYCLLRARRISKEGTLAAMIDTGPTSYSRNMFALVGKLKCRLLFGFTELTPDGTIVVSFEVPPFPACRNEDEITANIARFDAELARIRRGSPIPPAAAIPNTPSAKSAA